MRHAGEHLAHGGELLRLDKLLFQTLEFRDVAGGDHDAIDFAGFVEKRAEVAAQPAPLPLLAAHPDFQRGKRLPAAHNFREERKQRGAIFHVRAPAKR